MRVKQEAGLESPDHAQPTLIIQEGEWVCVWVCVCVCVWF